MKKNFWKNKRVLITGANGFLGYNFFSKLKKSSFFVIGVDLQNNHSKDIIKVDILTEKKLEEVCIKEKINLIIHCAALDGSAYFKKNNLEKIILHNFKMTANVLKVAKKLAINELVIFSSAEIYSDKINTPIKESDDYTKYPLPLDNGYAVSKILVEMMSNLYTKNYKLKILLPRPTNIYGPGDKINTVNDRVIPSMINRVLSDQQLEIWGDGQQLRNFVYIKDLIEAVLQLVESGHFTAVNIASSESVSIKGLAELISDLSGKKPNMEFIENNLGGVKNRIINTSKLNGLINFKTTKLSVGLTETIRSYRQKKYE